MITFSFPIFIFFVLAPFDPEMETINPIYPMILPIFPLISNRHHFLGFLLLICLNFFFSSFSFSVAS